VLPTKLSGGCFCVRVYPIAAALLDHGRRIGIFVWSGAGKSATLGIIARHAAADVSLIYLVSESGCEVRGFHVWDLGEERIAGSIVVVATSDTLALVWIKACWVATAFAEAFRDDDLAMLLLMDLGTRLAMAQREAGLVVVEPLVLFRYPPDESFSQRGTGTE
jgi:flagellar biosynthesis/type III secretory pathway ATPase